jgi:hypothetical protein
MLSRSGTGMQFQTQRFYCFQNATKFRVFLRPTRLGKDSPWTTGRHGPLATFHEPAQWPAGKGRTSNNLRHARGVAFALHTQSSASPQASSQPSPYTATPPVNNATNAFAIGDR